MVRFLICCLFFLNVNAAFAAAYHLVRQSPYSRNVNSVYGNYYNTIPILNEDLSALEKYTLNRTYSRENPVIRLERLENLALGSVQNGDLRSRYKNVEAAILSRPNYINTKRSALGNIVNYFTGQATGVTPPVLPNSNYYSPADMMGIYGASPSYGNQRFNQYSNGIFGHGYSLMNSTVGNGSSVTILP